MSPVGLTVLIGDILKKSKKDEVRGSVLAYTVRDAIKNATYVGGTLIPLIVIGAPIGPMSAGPAAPFFQKIDSLGMTPREYTNSLRLPNFNCRGVCFYCISFPHILPHIG